MRLPSQRLEPVRREAMFAVAWAMGHPERPPDPHKQEAILSGVLAPNEDPGTIRAWRYARAMQFVQGWYGPFPWNGQGAEHLLRILEGRRAPAEPREDHLFLEVKQRSAEAAQALARVPLLEIAAYGGAIPDPAAADLESVEMQLLLLGMRLLLLKHGYVQALFAPIEAVWRDGQPPSRAAFLGRRGPGHPGPEPAPEEELGASLDRWTEILYRAGCRAEEAWQKLEAIVPRSALQEAILTAAFRNGRITAGDVLRLTGANRNTVKDNLTRLVKSGLLKKRGEKRGTVYVPA